MVKRRGVISVVEFTAALVVLAVAGAMLAELLVTLSAQRRAAEQRMVATQEALNLLDEALALPDEKLTESQLASLVVSPDVDNLLPEAKATWELSSLEPSDADPPGRQIAVTVAWKGRYAHEQPAVRLIGWKFPLPEDAP